jgi:hypothetical protein
MRLSAMVQLTMSFTALRRHAALRGNVERQQGNEQKGMDMLSNNKKLIAVIGATGQQGGGVVRALQASGEFKVRALTRNPDKHRQLADEVVKADLDRPETLEAAFKGAYGVFLVTNFREKGADELKQATACCFIRERNKASTSQSSTGKRFDSSSQACPSHRESTERARNAPFFEACFSFPSSVRASAIPGKLRSASTV